MNIKLNDKFETTAVFNGKHFHHFGIHPSTAMLYGDDPKKIKNIYFYVAITQDIPEESTPTMEADYWGWFDYRTNRFTMIYPKRFLLSMCFPSGIEVSEEAGHGKAYRLSIPEHQIPSN